MWIHLLTTKLLKGASEAAVVVAEAVNAGPGGRIFPARKRRARVIRYSDFETREAYEQALRAAIPMSEVKPIETIPRTLADEDEDEDAVIFMLLKMLH